MATRQPSSDGFTRKRVVVDVDEGVSAPPTNMRWVLYNEFGKANKLALECRPGTRKVLTDTNYTQINGLFSWPDVIPGGNSGVVYFGTNSANGRDRISFADYSYNFVHANASGIGWLNRANTSAGTPAVTWTRPYVGEMWYYPAGGAATAITGPSNPNGRIVYMKGWYFVAANPATSDTGRIYNCATLNDFTSSWNDYVSSDSSTDYLITVWKHRNYLVAFGTESMEFYQITDNTAGSPLKLVPDASKAIGLAEPLITTGGITANSTIVDVGDSTYFIGKKGGSKQYSIWELSGTEVKELPSPFITNKLVGGGNDTYPPNNNIIIWGLSSFSHKGYTYLAVGPYVYCFLTKKWAYWLPTSGGTSSYIGNNATVMYASDLSASITQICWSNSILRLDDEIFKDATTASLGTGGSTFTQTLYMYGEDFGWFGTAKRKVQHSITPMSDVLCDGSTNAYPVWTIQVDDIGGGTTSRTWGRPEAGSGSLGGFLQRSYTLSRATTAIFVNGKILGVEHVVSAS